MHISVTFLCQFPYNKIQLLLYVVFHQINGGGIFQILIRRAFFQVLGENFGKKRTVGRSWYFFGSILCPGCYLHILAMTFLEITSLSRCGPTVRMCIPHFSVPAGLCFAVTQYRLFDHSRPITLFTQY